MLVSQAKYRSNTLARENIECSILELSDSLTCLVTQLLKLAQQVMTIFESLMSHTSWQC